MLGFPCVVKSMLKEKFENSVYLNTDSVSAQVALENGTPVAVRAAEDPDGDDWELAEQEIATAVEAQWGIWVVVGRWVEGDGEAKYARIFKADIQPTHKITHSEEGESQTDFIHLPEVGDAWNREGRSRWSVENGSWLYCGDPPRGHFEVVAL